MKRPPARATRGGVRKPTVKGTGISGRAARQGLVGLACLDHLAVLAAVCQRGGREGSLY